MAAAKSKKKVEVEEIDDELDEDELDLDDLADDDEDDETEDEEEEDEDEDEDDEVPAPKKKAAKGKTAAKKKKTSKSTVSAQDLADALSTDEKKVNGRELRVMLRQKGIDKIAKNENNRYEWDSIEAALEQMGFEDLDDARDALLESRDQRLEELKDKVAKKKGAKKKKTKAPEPEEEEDEDEDEDDDEEEDEEPAPKKKTPAKKTTRARK